MLNLSKRSVLIVSLLFYTACSGNLGPNVDPRVPVALGVKEAVIAVGTIQHTAIELNRAGLVPDRDVRVIGNAVKSIDSTLGTLPQGWQAVVNSGLDEMLKQLDEPTKLRIAPYVEIAKLVIARLK